jgi:hypothetical protein
MCYRLYCAALVRNKDHAVGLQKEELKVVVGSLEKKLDEKTFGPVVDWADVVIDASRVVDGES